MQEKNNVTLQYAYYIIEIYSNNLKFSNVLWNISYTYTSILVIL